MLPFSYHSNHINCCLNLPNINHFPLFLAFHFLTSSNMPSCTLPYKTLPQLSHWMKKFLSTLSRGFLFPHSWQAFILTFNVPVFLFLLVLLVLLVVVIFIPLSCSKAGHLCGLLYTSLISYINFSCCLRRFVRPLKPSIVLSCRPLALWTVLCQIVCFRLIYPQAS